LHFAADAKLMYTNIDTANGIETLKDFLMTTKTTYQKTSLLLFSLKSLKQSCPTMYSASQWLPLHTAGNQLKKLQVKGVTLFTLFGFDLTIGLHS